MAASRYLRAFGATALALAAATLLLCRALDPTGLLRPMGLGGGLCRPGIHASDERYVKPVLAHIHRPAEIVLGSSRARQGFAPNAFPGRRVANLAISGASLREIDALARAAAAEPSLRRIWLGLDFGAFAERETARDPLVFPAAGADRGWTALRFALFDQRAPAAAFSLALSPGSCGNPPTTPLGFRRQEADPIGRPAGHDAGPRRTIIRSWTVPDNERSRLYSERLDRLDALLARLRARNVEAILYLSPASPAYRSIVAESGLAPLYRRWRADVAALVRRHGGHLVESDTPEFLIAIPAPACRAASREDCLFSDITHFRPLVGAAIVRAANQNLERSF